MDLSEATLASDCKISKSHKDSVWDRQTMHPDHSNFSLDDEQPAYYVPWVGGCKSHTTQVTTQLHVYKYIITILQLKGPSTGRFSDIHQFSPTYLFTTFSTLNLMFWWTTYRRYHICPYIVIMLHFLSTLMQQRYWPRSTARRSSCATSILQGIPEFQFQRHIEVVWEVANHPQTSHFSRVPEVVLEPSLRCQSLTEQEESQTEQPTHSDA